MQIKSLRTAKLKDQKVLLRVDYNVPLKGSKIVDDTRIIATLPTLKYLLSKKAKIIIMSHLGRPDGKKDKKLKLDPLAKYLGKLLKKPIKKLDECIGSNVEKAISKMKSGEIIMLENTRFYPGEEKCDSAFTKKLAKLGNIFVNDSFATAHRAHATTSGLAKYLPTYCGFLLEAEINNLNGLIKNVKHPLTIIIGGAKIDTKIGLIKNFINKADYFLIGGGLANTFLAASGFDIGKSLYEKDKLELAQEIMLEIEAMRENFVLPEDVIVADKISDRAQTLDIPAEDVMGDMKILDLGRKTLKQFEAVLKKSKTVIWNGPVGLFEYKPFQTGTKKIAEILTKNKKIKSIIGGGDTIDAIKNLGFKEKNFSFVSTGGGAMLEYLEGAKLPGVQVVLK